MNQRQAKKHAHRFAWKVLQNATDQGKISDCLDAKTEADRIKIEKAYDDLIQQHFNRSATDEDIQND